ncbi:MAG: hypothetical protein MZU97_06640 [Bacillus subtilis]|nr:hypothetical protein [Bacillus subtilis]
MRTTPTSPARFGAIRTPRSTASCAPTCSPVPSAETSSPISRCFAGHRRLERARPNASRCSANAK